MIREFVREWENGARDRIRSRLEKAHPEDYKALVQIVVEELSGVAIEYSQMNAKRIYLIDDGHYQGTLVYIIAEQHSQPSTYWYVRISYGSCSGCDTLKRIKGNDDLPDDPPTKEQVDRYVTLALHIVQQLKMMDGEAVGAMDGGEIVW